MMLTVLVAFVESGSMEQWLSPKAGLEQLFPGDFGQLLRSPDLVIVEALVDEATPEEAPFGPDAAKFSVVARRELTGAARSKLLEFVAKPTNWKAQNHERCAPNRCVFVMMCGGFRPSIALTLEQGSRRARVLICVECSEAWVDRFDSDGRRVGREQAWIEGAERWQAMFRGVVNRPASFPARAGTSSSADAGTRAPASE